MTIVTRAGKGSALSFNEMDTNFTDLRDGVGGLQIDIHYQSTSVGTKAKAPNFYV